MQQNNCITNRNGCERSNHKITYLWEAFETIVECELATDDVELNFGVFVEITQSGFRAVGGNEFRGK